MRILLLAPHPFFQDRGTPIAERALLEVLARQGHELEVLTFHEGEDPPIANCTIHRIPKVPGTEGIRPGFSVKKLACDVALFWACLGLVRRRRYDLIHAVEESAFIALVMKRLFGVPFVYDMDSSLPQQMIEKYAALRAVRGWMETAERRVVRASTGVVAVCKALEETARGYDAGKTIARVEDISLLAPDEPDAERLAATINATGPIVMYVGNLEPYQGIDLLVDSFPYALRAVADAHLVIIGGAEADIRRYAQRAAALGVAAHVHLVGPRPVDQLGSFVRQATVLASPRIKGQNTPMKIYSYLDSGRPVLATRLPTHTQVLDDDIACLVPPEPEAMGAGLASLLQDPARREALAGRARERVQAEYSPEAFERKVVAFYDVLQRKVTGAGAPVAS